MSAQKVSSDSYASAAPLGAAEAALANGNPLFGIEVRGFERIPDAERNMTLSQVGPLWLATNLNLLSIILGCVAITFGLNLWLAFAACIVGNLPYVYLAFGSIGAVRAGLPITTLSRAVFGIRGNFPNAFLGWISSVAYEVIGTIFGVYALRALFPLIGWHHSDTTAKLVATCVQLIFSGGVAMLGHATMVFLQKFSALFLGVVLFVIFLYTCSQVDWAQAGTAHVPLATKTIFAAFMTACGVMASQPVGYLFNGPDWVRYLPTATRAGQIFHRVFWWTFVPSVIVTAMGAMWASLGNMSDPVAGLKPFIPTWLFVTYILAVFGGALAANVPVFYSSGLSLQSMGLNVKRWLATAIDVFISTAVVIYILFVQDFTTALNDFVALLLVWVGPYGGIWMCDGFLRHWVYESGTVHRDPARAAMPGVSRRIPGWVALIAGMSVGVLTMRSPLYDGPVATALGGMDLNWVLGFFVSAGTYYILMAAQRRRVRPEDLVVDPSSTSQLRS
jgi:nucleobase:cation symporter-1, NCS1 family